MALDRVPFWWELVIFPLFFGVVYDFASCLQLTALIFFLFQVVKLNDTNIWRERYAMLVPHTFLYYFGSGSAEDLRPHGVIDLELYTDIKILEGEKSHHALFRRIRTNWSQTLKDSLSTLQ